MSQVQIDRNGNWVLIDSGAVVRTFDSTDPAVDNQAAALAYQRVYDYIKRYRAYVDSFVDVREELIALRSEWDALGLSTLLTDDDFAPFPFTRTDFVNTVANVETIVTASAGGILTNLYRVRNI